MAALWMYIDRVCVSTVSPNIAAELGVEQNSKAMNNTLGAFFFTYALFQIPVGALADRYGPRLILTVAIAGWSVCTMLTRWIDGLGSLMVIRLLLGAFESGAYPAAAGLVQRLGSVNAYSTTIAPRLRITQGVHSPG